MESKHLYFVIILIANSKAFTIPEDFQNIGQNSTSLNETKAIYDDGVHRGIIDPMTYSFESFERDDRNFFKNMYKEYISYHGSLPMNYQEWLIMNNFGLLPDTKRSLIEKKTVRRVRSTDSNSTDDYDHKTYFLTTVRRGDILITLGKGFRGIIGHAAIMVTDDYVLEMPGGAGSLFRIKDNNRLIDKEKWYDIHADDWIYVYSSPDKRAAAEAAKYAHRVFYNPFYGLRKMKHITYSIWSSPSTLNPNYCSKMVIQAYYYGAGHVLESDALDALWILPTRIPLYFRNQYSLRDKGRY